jgi:hypothetical protein
MSVRLFLIATVVVAGAGRARADDVYTNWGTAWATLNRLQTLPVQAKDGAGATPVTAAEPKPASTKQPLQDWLVASTFQDKPFDQFVRDQLAAVKVRRWEQWFDGAAFGHRYLAEDLVLDGKGLNDVSAAPGTTIRKSGEGVAIVAVKDGGKYTVSMDGPGTMYLIGMYDYSFVQVISKTGDGDLVWVLLDPDAFCAGPTVKGKLEGKGRVRSGTEKEVNDLRSK